VRKPVKKPISPFFFVLIFYLTLVEIAPIQANPGLNLIVKTDKEKYYAKDMVQVFGNLTLDGVLVTDGLVGIQIQNSENDLLIIRTILTGSLPPEPPYVSVQYVVSCDSAGNPKFSFHRKELAYFKMRVANLDIEPRDVLMTVNTYYNDSTPFGYAAIQTTIPGQTFPTFIISIPIPVDAVIGTATVYANAYTDWPEYGGTPYCKEVNNTFEITEGTFGVGQLAQSPLPTIQQTNETGNYNTTFGLPRKSPYGNYTVYVTSRYLGESIFNSTTFIVYILGDLGGPVNFVPTFFAFDGEVDGYDFALFIACYKGLGP